MPTLFITELYFNSSAHKTNLSLLRVHPDKFQLTLREQFVMITEIQFDVTPESAISYKNLVKY